MVWALRIRAEQRGGKAAWFLAAATVAVLMSVFCRDIFPSELARPLPLFMTIFALTTVVALVKNRTDSFATRQLITRLMLIVLGFGLLGKILLNARFYNYGFVLAVPATMPGGFGLARLDPGDHRPVWRISKRFSSHGHCPARRFRNRTSGN